MPLPFIQIPMELTQEYFDSFVKELTARLDQFDKKFDHLEARLDFFERELKEIRQELNNLSKRDLEDSAAFAKEILTLNKRVAALERQLKLKHAS